MKWIETITPKQAVEELGVPYHGWMREMDRAWISEDQKYSVMSRLLRTEWGKVEHVTITAATALASIVLIVAALPMAGWSWAVNQMAGKMAERKKEGT